MVASNQRLGRGLESLLAAQPRVAEPAGTLPIDVIRPGSAQPRGRIRPESLDELVASIRVQGVIQPIVVRPLAGLNEYEIVAGERRWQAARLAGLTHIPAVVRELSNQDAIAIALIENIQRQDLTPTEEARSLQRLITEFTLTHADVATAVGRSRAAVSNLLRLLDLPSEILALIEDRALGMGHARALLGLPTEQEQIRLGQRIAQKGLSVRETEALVRKALKQMPSTVASPVEMNMVSTVLTTPKANVMLHKGPHGERRLVIDFKDPSILDAILRAVHRVLDQ